MRYILIILVFLSVGANAQMVIKAHANYRPYAQPAANLLLDDYPNAAAAYSLRKLDKDYTGAAIRVRKDTTGQPEQDIGFDANGNLDSTALKQFLNLRSGFVTTWYDQSGNGRNMTQSTQSLQPRIALNGILEKTGNIQNVRFISSSSTRLSVSRIFNNDNFSVFAIVRPVDSVANNSILTQHSGGTDIGRTVFLSTGNTVGSNKSKATLAFNNGTTYQIHTTTNYSLTNFTIFESDSDDNGNSNIYLNGGGNSTQTGQTWTPLNTNTVIGSIGNGTNALDGRIAEMILYTTKQANADGIRNNINDYYNLYWNGDFTGILDTYPNSAAAYSLRNLSSTYTGPLIRVRKDTTGQPEMDIYGDYYGNLDTVGLKNFLLTRSGFVTTWYDQSGNSRNLLESTQANQPRIANLGVIDRENGEPYVRFDGSNDRLALANDLSLTNQSFFSVTRVNQNYTTTSPAAVLWRSDTIISTRTTTDAFFLGASTGDLTNERISWITIQTPNALQRPFGVGETTTDVNTGNYIFTAIYNFSTAGEGIARNGIVQTLNVLTNGDFNNTDAYPRAFKRLGSTPTGTNAFNGGYFEFIVYPSVQSNNRTAIESNINSYYGIY